MQVKLLRVLQERTFERVGSNQSRQCDVRIVAATHRDLEEAIEEGRFRADLYYRLNVFPIEMPPLRERVEDLELLTGNIIRRCADSGLDPVTVTPAAFRVLRHHSWPGNIRELSNLLERLCVLYPGSDVDISDLPARYTADAPVRESDRQQIHEAREAGPLPQDFGLPGEDVTLKEYLANIELSLIRRALHETEGVIAQAARRLNVRRTTLVEKMRKYGLN